VDPLALAGLGLAGVAAGAVNAIAGGGTLITFPSLLAADFSARVANVTSTVAIWPGTIGGSLAYRREVGARRERVAKLSLPSLAGGAVGSALLLATSERVFDAVVPFLVLLASLLLALNRRLSELAARYGLHADADGRLPASLYAAMFLNGIYGGYFGAGLGILTLAALAILAPDDLQHANAVKGILAALINSVAVVIFAASGLVEWQPALVMALCAIAGGYAGVALARRLDAGRLRNVVVAWGLLMSAVLFAR
jgi:uncharacterized membrane protein YfcA